MLAAFGFNPGFIAMSVLKMAEHRRGVQGRLFNARPQSAKTQPSQASRLGKVVALTIRQIRDAWTRLMDHNHLLLTEFNSTVTGEEPFPVIFLAPDFRDCSGPFLRRMKSL